MKRLKYNIKYCIGITKHKIDIFYNIVTICVELIKRAMLHDLSKFSKVEMNCFAPKAGMLKTMQYGSIDYFSFLNEEKEAIQHHYKINTHHPEYYNNDYTKMSMYDIIEMYCDFKSSVKKNKNGNLDRSFEINKNRFHLSDEIINLMKSLK